MIGLYVITALPSVYFDPAGTVERLRRARGKEGGRVHVTTAKQPERGVRIALCGSYPPPSRQGGRSCDPGSAKPWEWTDDDIDCQKCLTLIPEKTEGGILFFATPQEAGAIADTLSRPHPVPKSVTARDRAIRAGIQPSKRIGALGHPSGNGAAEMAADAAAAVGDRDLAALALAELRPGEHYPACDQSGEISREDWVDGGLCSCYGDRFLA